MTGGISRLKYHLAKLPGHDVGLCTAVTPEIMRMAHDAIHSKDRKREESAANRAELAAGGVARTSGTYDYDHPDPTEGSVGGSTAMGSASVRVAASSFFVPRNSIKSMVKKREKEEADRIMGRMFFWSDLPLTITRNNPFFQPMCDAIAIVGPRYKCPTYEEIRGPILQAEKKDINTRLEEFKQSWEISGCTLMSDGWSDAKGRTLINFLVQCPKGTMFIKSVDASAQVKEAALLCELLDGVLQEIGVDNVVQIITDNAANYVAAGRLLMERHPSLFWSPCAAHCIDLMLEDVGKIPFIKEVVDQARSITKFIYNHAWVLSLMRRCTRNRELLRPGIT